MKRIQPSSAAEFARAFREQLDHDVHLAMTDPAAYAAELERRRQVAADHDASTGCGRLVDMGQWCSRANPCFSCAERKP